MIPSGSISTVIENSIATITFSHPASNSFPSTLLQQLMNELNKVDKNGNIVKTYPSRKQAAEDHNITPMKLHTILKKNKLFDDHYFKEE